MSTTTEIFRALPELAKGISLNSGSQWALPGGYKVIAPMTNSDLNIMGIQFQVAVALAADITYNGLVEVAFGAAGYEVTRIQLPWNCRNDTAVGYYIHPMSMFLPRPVFVPKGTVLSVRVVIDAANTPMIDGVKLLVQDTTRPVQPYEQINLQNQHSVRVGSGMSVSERGGVF